MFVVVMAVLCIVCIIPTAIVFASAITDPTIGMNGVNGSQLTVGMTGVEHSDLLLDYNPADWHINPSEQPSLLIIPLVFFAFALLLLIDMAFSKDKDIKKLIYAAILIMMALALLQGVQFNVNSLLGG
jgi:hypothetical protein